MSIAKRTIKLATPPATPSWQSLEEMGQALRHIRLATAVLESSPDERAKKDAIATLVDATEALDALHREWLVLREVKS
jgi:hypothetical protein